MSHASTVRQYLMHSALRKGRSLLAKKKSKHRPYVAGRGEKGVLYMVTPDLSYDCGRRERAEKGEDNK